jgi:hypothetical protein
MRVVVTVAAGGVCLLVLLVATWRAAPVRSTVPSTVAPLALAESRSPIADVRLGVSAPAPSLDERVTSEPLRVVVEGARGESPAIEEERPDLVLEDPSGGRHEVLPASRYRIEDGRLAILHPSGGVAESGAWDGRWKQGVWQYFDEAGRRTLEGAYVDGRASGPWVRWRADGTVAEEAETVAGEFHGWRRVWRDDGSFDDALSGPYVRGARR